MGMTAVGLEFAPLNVPYHRRLQTLAVITFTLLFLAAPIVSCLLWLYCLFSRLWWVAIGYLIWIIYDVRVQRTQCRGGRRWEWMRNAALWRYFRDFFPVTLIKTSDLDPNRNYIFGYHPHGIISCGAFCNFASEATGFSALFPGIRPTVLTISANFTWPLLRGIVMWMGMCDASRESLTWILTKQGTGNAAILVVGGAAEALEARPEQFNLTLRNRKGFIRLAIQTGASLVPVFSFGENDLYQQANNPNGSFVRAFQQKFKCLFGFAPIMFYGRGVFNYTMGVLPFRKPINTVVGKPIAVQKDPEPSNEMVDDTHALYMAQLGQLFDSHKTKYGVSADTKLTFE